MSKGLLRKVFLNKPFLLFVDLNGEGSKQSRSAPKASRSALKVSRPAPKVS